MKPYRDLARQQDSADRQWRRYAVLCGVDYTLIEEINTIDDRITKPRRLAVNCYMPSSWVRMVERNAGDVRRIDPTTGQFIESTPYREYVERIDAGKAGKV